MLLLSLCVDRVALSVVVSVALAILSVIASACQVPVPTIPISAMFAAIEAAGPAQVQVSLGDHEAVKRWWQHAETLPEYTSHPGRGDVPLLLYFGGANIYSEQEYLIFKWSSIVTSLSDVFDEPFLILAVEGARVAEKSACHQEVGRYMSWQANVLLTRKWPTVGYDKEEFPSGSLYFKRRGQDLGQMLGAVVGWQGDAKARREVHVLSQHYGAMLCCDQCRAQLVKPNADPTMRYTNLSPHAPHAKTQISNAEYLATTPVVSTYFGIAGFRKEHVFWDWAHNVFLGVCKHLLPSIVICWAEECGS